MHGEYEVTSGAGRQQRGADCDTECSGGGLAPTPTATPTLTETRSATPTGQVRGRTRTASIRRMPTPRRRSAKLAIHPLTPDRWPDLVRLFGPSGACAGCWCTWWRMPNAAFAASRGADKRRRLQRYVKAGHVPGLIAYRGAEPVGWVAVEPRAAYPRLARSRLLAPVDEEPVWSITCFYVAREQRGAGLTRALIEAAVRHARARGAPAVEAYPVEPRGRVDDDVVYHGAASTFAGLGFREVARRGPGRPMVRKGLGRGR